MKERGLNTAKQTVIMYLPKQIRHSTGAPTWTIYIIIIIIIQVHVHLLPNNNKLHLLPNPGWTRQVHVHPNK